MLVSKDNLAILEAAATVKESQYSLNYIKLDPEKKQILAVNSHALFTSRLPDLNDNEFIESEEIAENPTEVVYVSAKAFKKAMKNIPPAKGFPPALQNIQVLTSEKHNHLITSDLETTDVVKEKKEEIDFPDVEAVVSSVSHGSKEAFVLSVENLELLVKIAKKQKVMFVRFDYFGPLSPLKIKSEDTNDNTGTGFDGILMPSRLRDEDNEKQ